MFRIATIFLVLFITAPLVIAQNIPASTLKRMSVEDLMNVEVTSVSRRPESLFETASAIQVITQADIRRSGATSIPEALRLASNLDVAQIDARQWAISSRGFNSTTSNKLLVLIDGRTVYTPLYAGVFWDVQDTLLEDIERIEVISGPGGSVWGANAVNGVINIITKSARDTQGAVVAAGAGTALRGFGGVRYGASLGPDIQFRMYGKYFNRGSFPFTDGRDSRDGWDSGQTGFRAEWNDGVKDRVTLQGDLYTGRAGQLTTADIGLGGGNVLGRWERTFSADSDFKLQMYYDRTNRRVPALFGEGLDTYDIDLQHRRVIAGGHDVIWGFGYRFIDDTIANSASVAFSPPHVSRQWFSGFLQDQVTVIPDRLQATFGTKIEHNDYTGIELQPTGRLVLKVASGHTLWGAVSRAVRTPSRIDRELFSPAVPPFTLAGGAAFDSETLLAYEFGYRASLRRVALSMATYYNDYDNIRSLERTANQPRPLTVGNGFTSRSYGSEVSAEYQVLEMWRLRAAYSPFSIDFYRHADSTDPNLSTTEANDPSHKFFLRSSLDLPARFTFDNALRFVSRIDIQSVPRYTEFDTRLAWTANSSVELSLTGQNLLHRHHAEFGGAARRRGIERNVSMKLLWSF
jgi:iron complex outermembrane recepter protein